jgi:hypothetical protein
MALTVPQIKVIAWIEEWWLRKESFPPVDALKSFWPDFDLKESLNQELFLKALENRGISLPSADDVLSNEQLAAIAVMSNFRDTRSPTAKLRAIGVSWTRWQGWMKNKHFKEFLHDLAANNFSDSIDVAQRGLLSSVEKGNVDAIKFYLEATGRYTPQTTESINIKMVLAKLLEVIQMHVKDQETLRSIAADFEVVMSGGSPSVQKEIAI